MNSHRAPVALVVAAGMVATLLALAGCRSRPEAAAHAPVLRIGFGIGSSAKDTSLPALTDLLYAESLFSREWDGRQASRLATEWGWTENGRQLWVRMKEGVRMHDGTLLDATLAQEILEGFLAKRKNSSAVGLEHVTGVRAVDARTIVFDVTQPDMFLLTALSDRKLIHPRAPDVGTGPFKLVTRTPNVELARFDGYHGGVSPLAGVRIITYDTPRGVWSGFMRNEIDAAQDVSRGAVEFIEDSSKVQVFGSLSSFYVSLGFNQRHHAFRHASVRRAINEALHRDAIVARAMSGLGRVAEGPIWPLHWAYKAPASKYGYSPETSRARLDSAGFRLPAGGEAGQLRARFSFTCLVYDEDPQYERIALMVQRQLFDVGIDMRIELLGLDTFASHAKEGKFDAFIMPTNAGRSLDLTYRFWHSATAGRVPLLDSGYTGADALLDKLRASTSESDTRDIIAALSQQFHDDAPAAFIAWLGVTRAVDSRFDVGENLTEDPFARIWQWRPRGQ